MQKYKRFQKTIVCFLLYSNCICIIIIIIILHIGHFEEDQHIYCHQSNHSFRSFVAGIDPIM